jgi:hypothetical protein
VEAVVAYSKVLIPDFLDIKLRPGGAVNYADIFRK